VVRWSGCGGNTSSPIVRGRIREEQEIAAIPSKYQTKMTVEASRKPAVTQARPGYFSRAAGDSTQRPEGEPVRDEPALASDSVYYSVYCVPCFPPTVPPGRMARAVADVHFSSCAPPVGSLGPLGRPEHWLTRAGSFIPAGSVQPFPTGVSAPGTRSGECADPDTVCGSSVSCPRMMHQITECATSTRFQ
jgi:hypothetical protein